jgi:hypothetical protein
MKQDLKGRRVAGFKVDEIMVGSHRFIGREEDLPMHFNITWGHKNLVEYFNPFSPEFLCAGVAGVITIGGLVHKADCTGSLKLLYFKERKVRYELEFSDKQGRKYLYVGEKVNIWPWNLHKSHITCFGTVTERETGKDISKSVVYFPLRELISFTRSIRRDPPHNTDKTLSLKRKDRGGEQIRPYNVLSSKEARIIAAMAGGIIPRGGKSFESGAADLEDKWLPRTDNMLSRMPVFTRLELKGILHVINYILPLVYLKRLTPLIALDEQKRTQLFRIAEKSKTLGMVSILLAKVLVLPAFYGLAEVKKAIGYKERFSNSRKFKGLKD